MPAVDAPVHLLFFFFAFVMRKFVVRTFDAIDEGEIFAADVAGEHERADARGIGLERQHHHVEHQADLFGVVDAALSDAGGVVVETFQARTQFVDRFAGQRVCFDFALAAFGIELNALFDGAHGAQIFVEFALVADAYFAAQSFRVFQHEIEHALVVGGIYGACGVDRCRAEETVEGLARIDFVGHRRRRGAPGNVRAVEARVAHVDVHAGGVAFDAEFERRERGEVADALRGDLIHRDAVAAQVAAGGAFDRGAGEESAGLDVVAVAGVGFLVH